MVDFFLDQNELKKEYDKHLEAWESLKAEGVFILERALKHNGIKFHNISSRVKEFKSLCDKAVNKEEINPVGAFKDLVGIRVVCLLLSDIDRISKVIDDEFDVVDKDDKIKGGSASDFGYMSYHVIVKMKPEYAGPRYDLIKDIPFEIQIRTIAMDAWAATSHYLSYKSDVDIPKELKKDFYALSGLFYVADTHFEMFFKEIQVERKAIGKKAKLKNGLLEYEINYETLRAYLMEKYPDRIESETVFEKSLSECVEELTSAGYLRISQLEEILKKTQKAFLQFEKDTPPHGDQVQKYSVIGILRISLFIYDDDYVVSAHARNKAMSLSSYKKYKKYIEED